MKYLMNIALAGIFAITAFCLPVIYGKGIFCFVVLLSFTFLFILIVIAVNESS